MELELSGNSAIVTGASRGIGKAIAQMLAEEGVDVALAARDAAALDQNAADIEARTGKRPATVSGDLKDPATCQRLVDKTLERFGKLDILVNNAGDTKRGDFLEFADEDYLAGFALKYHATVRLCRMSWPHLKATGGSIVNIIGIGSRTPSAEFTIGGSVNSALVNFTKAIADRASADGIRVNAVNPGHILTDRLHSRIEKLAEVESLSLAEAEDQLRRSYGIARYGAPEDIARAVAFLCSRPADYIHGATLDVDGGATRGI